MSDDNLATQDYMDQYTDFLCAIIDDIPLSVVIIALDRIGNSLRKDVENAGKVPHELNYRELAEINMSKIK